MAFTVSGAHAERFLFQRGTSLYLGERDGKETRKLLDIGAGSGRLWSVSPDGRRVVWLKPLSGGDEGSLEARPIAVFLTDITGRRQKRLFSTDALLDRQGRKITVISPIGAETTTTTLADWAPASLSWSADGRTLYLGCTRVGGSGVMTVTVDGQAGTAIVDADGNWKCLAAITQPDARSTYLTGVSVGRDSTAPLLICNLALGNAWTPVPPTGGTPPYVAALWPALSPDGKSVAFTSLPRGLWLAEAQGTKLKRLVSGEVLRPRFADDGKTLFFLAPRPTTTERQAYDLYELTPGSATPRVVLSDVDWFDVVPD